MTDSMMVCAEELQKAHERIAELEAERDTMPRAAIMAFARLMEQKLQTKDAHKGDWREESMGKRLRSMSDELEEVYDALNDDGSLLLELADLGLEAMMTADKVRPLCEHDGRGR